MNNNDSEEDNILWNEIKEIITSKNFLEKCSNSCEILEFLYLGNKIAATDFDTVFNFTHILNVAQRDVQTGPDFYGNNIIYKSVDCYDDEEFDISLHFDECLEFIEDVHLKHQENDKYKVLVHCAGGVSRSCTIVLAYLMKYNNMNLLLALNFVYEKRKCIHPNDNFIRLLIEFQKKI
eukprot:TRINITY_DN12191_c0_g1_i1.p1 TRINITY_DN12191_c0_g1~~TRINITY_DN12191_c0_g1_i1.p1  ORF type:complete len:178 (-),score=30.19 TRINITY_DN12191_c0_g1_i1:105-638(-)